MADDKSMWVRIFGDASGAQTAMRQTSTAVKDSMAQIREHTDGLAAVFSRVNAAMVGLGAVLAGGAMFRESVAETIKLTKEATALGKQFGVTTSQAGVLAIALDDVHVSTEQATAANNRITNTLRTSEGAFTALGVATREQNGHYRSSLDIMLDVNAALSNIREGTDRNIEGQKIYGRSWADLSDTLRLTKETMAAAQEKADELGLTIGERSVASTKAYRDAMNDVGDVVTAVKKAVGDALLPVLTRTGAWFASIGPQAVNLTKNAMLGLRIVVEGVATAFTTAYNIISGVVQEITTALLSVADALNRALRGDFSGAASALRVGGQQMVDIAKEKAGNIAQAFKDAQAGVADAMAGTWGRDKPITGGSAATGYSSGPAAKDAKPKKAKEELDAELASLRAQLESYRNNMDERIEIAKQALERAITVYGIDSKEFATAQKEMVATVRQKAEQIKQIEATISAAKVNASLASIDQEEQAARFEVETGNTTKAQLIQQLKAFEQARYQIKLQALNDSLALAAADPDRNPVVLAQLHAQAEALEAEHQGKVQELRRESIRVQSTFADTLQQSLQSGFQGTIQSFLSGTMKVSTAIRSLMKSVGDAVIAAIAQTQARRATAHIAEMMMKKKEIMAGAAGAAVAGTESAAKIPYTGWAIAIGAGAAIMSAMSGYKAAVSAAGGFDIPAGSNPLVQTHAREMILPAHLADKVRNVTEPPAAAAPNFHFHVSAIDTHGVRDFFMGNTPALAEAIARAYRDGYTVPR